MNLPTWPHPHAGVNGNEDDRESVSCRSMNRDKSFTTDDSLTGQSEIESKHSPLLSPSYLSDPSKLCMEATTPTNDYDELELATSECSESDMSWQSHLSKTTAISNALVSRPKKPVHLKQAKNFETRYYLLQFMLLVFFSRIILLEHWIHIHNQCKVFLYSQSIVIAISLKRLDFKSLLLLKSHLSVIVIYKQFLV